MSETLTTMKLERALEVARGVDPVMPSHHLIALLYISRHPGCSQGDLVEHLDTTTASAARICSRLSSWERPRSPGLGLIDVEVDIEDRRRRNLWLTTKGQKVVKRMVEVMK